MLDLSLIFSVVSLILSSFLTIRTSFESECCHLKYSVDVEDEPEAIPKKTSHLDTLLE